MGSCFKFFVFEDFKVMAPASPAVCSKPKDSDLGKKIEVKI